jgi:hypothetical protein
MEDVHVELQPGLPWQKEHSTGRRHFISKSDLNLTKKVVKCYIWSIELYGAETLTLRKADQNCVESFEMWCWRRMEKISWTDRVRNEEVLHRVMEVMNVLDIIKGRKLFELVTSCVGTVV